MAARKKSGYLIQSVAQALSLLEQFRFSEGELSISTLSRMLGTNKNKTYRLLATLEPNSFVSRNPSTGSYQLGIANLRLAMACARGRDILKECRPSLSCLAERSEETAILAMPGEGGLVCEDVVESAQPVRVVTGVGTRLSLASTAAGKVILAHGGTDVLQAAMERKKGRWAGPSVAGVSLAAELLLIRERGFAVSFEAFDREVSAVAAAVCNHAGKVIGAVSVVGPSFRLSRDRLNEEIAPLVVMSAREISVRMGFGEPVEKEGAARMLDLPLTEPGTARTVEKAGAIPVTYTRRKAA